jgi:hypothetical protein
LGILPAGGETITRAGRGFTHNRAGLGLRISHIAERLGSFGEELAKALREENEANLANR